MHWAAQWIDIQVDTILKAAHFNIQVGPDEMRATIQNKIEMKRVRNLKLQAEYKSRMVHEIASLLHALSQLENDLS